MNELIACGKTLPDAYHEALSLLKHCGEVTECADWNTTQKEVSMTMVVEEPLSEPRISKMFIGGPKELEQYRQEMLDGILDFEVAQGKWEYTYHDRMVNYPIPRDYEREDCNGIIVDSFNQVDFVIGELRRNPSSRRAVIAIRDVGTDAFSDDAACWQHAQYFIRDGKLECKVLFRSNDACKATFMNAFALICLQERIAGELGVPVGQYVHRANSFHCYENDFGMLDGYVSRIENAEDEYDVCFDYEDDWKEEMVAARSEIAKQVDELKDRGNAG